MNFDSFSEQEFNSYLAGFTDGEGYIGCKKNMGVRITLANCVPEVLRAIQKRLGYGTMKSQRQRENWRERWVLDISNFSDARKFFTRTRPYLLIKADAADAALEYIEKHEKQVSARRARNLAIRKAIESGETQNTVADRFGISQAMVSIICLDCKKQSHYQRITASRERRPDGTFKPSV